jgi:methionine-rich copper-binding protein CopC
MRLPLRTISATILVLSLAAAPPALAHARLRAAEPAVGSTVGGAPTELKLTFSETVEPAFCRVTVTDAHGMRVDAGAPQADPADGKRLLVPLKPLGPGVYTVTWHVTSTDTHRTGGHFSFTVEK